MNSYTPLFPPGIHDIVETEFDNRFVSGFPTSSTRKRLSKGLCEYIEALRPIGVGFELWIDGSFTTDKADPSDVDLILFASKSDLAGLSADCKTMLRGLLDKASSKSKYGCDVYFAHSEDTPLRSYWRGWFGFDRDEKPKGLARITVTA
jgi:hypothetical protein